MSNCSFSPEFGDWNILFPIKMELLYSQPIFVVEILCLVRLVETNFFYLITLCFCRFVRARERARGFVCACVCVVCMRVCACGVCVLK